jgi:predicted nucleotidyltransferase
MHIDSISDPRISEISEKVLQAAKDTLGDKLDKVILYGSYARGDYDHESDIDFFILADVSQEEAGRWRSDIRDKVPYIDLEYDILVSLKVTGTSTFNNYIDALPFYMNVIKDGVVLYG